MVFLKTQRLYLKEFEDCDAENLYRLDNDSRVMRYISSYTGNEKTLEECLSTIQSQKLYYSINEGMGIWPVFQLADDLFTGWAALKYLASTDDVEVGYRFLPEFWGKGYATEITKALIGYGFERLGLNKICAVAMPENKASVRVMEKSGMHFVKYDFFYNCNVSYYEIERQVQ